MIRSHKIQKLVLTASVFVGLFVLAFWLARLAVENATLVELVMHYGYAGIFLTSLISGLNLVVPVPAISFLPLFLESGLNLWISLGVMVCGVTIADSIAYMIGLSGRFFISTTNSSHIVTRLDALRTRWHKGPLVALFFFAALVPFPNEMLVIPLGFLGYQMRTLLPILFLGNGVFHLLVASGVIGLWNVL